MHDSHNIKRWVQRTLEVYSERGDQALEALEKEDFDRLEAVMRKRNAAYHNFLMAESALQRLGLDIGKEPGSMQMLLRIKVVNARLSEGIMKVRDELQGRLTKTVTARKKLAHFRASADQDNRFQGSV